MHVSKACGIDTERVEELRRSLRASGAHALLILAEDSRDPDLAPFVGPAQLGRCALVLGEHGTPRLLCLSPMEREEAEATGLDILDPGDLNLAELENRAPNPNQFFSLAGYSALTRVAERPVPVAIAGSVPAGVTLTLLQALDSGWEPSAGGEIMRTWRRKKTAAEIADCRRAAGVTGQILRRLASMLAASVLRDDELWLEGERLRVRRLRREVAQSLAAEGMDQPHGNIIAPGRDGGVPHSHGDDESGIPPRTSLVVDLFPRLRLYADLTRTFCVGVPPEPLARAHRCVEEALAEAEHGANPGVSGWDLQRATCARFASAGYSDPISSPGTTRGYVHNLGHGVGYELHEVPTFRQSTEDRGTLHPGDVITIEPGLYDPEAGYGVRLEDQLVVTDSGSEKLVDLPTALDPAAWRDA